MEGVASGVALSVVALAGNASPASAKPRRLKGGGPIVTLASGAQYQDMTIGDGATPEEGDRVAIHYSLYYKGEGAILRRSRGANDSRACLGPSRYRLAAAANLAREGGITRAVSGRIARG